MGNYFKDINQPTMLHFEEAIHDKLIGLEVDAEQQMQDIKEKALEKLMEHNKADTALFYKS